MTVQNQTFSPLIFIPKHILGPAILVDNVCQAPHRKWQHWAVNGMYSSENGTVYHFGNSFLSWHSNYPTVCKTDLTTVPCHATNKERHDWSIKGTAGSRPWCHHVHCLSTKKFTPNIPYYITMLSVSRFVEIIRKPIFGRSCVKILRPRDKQIALYHTAQRVSTAQYDQKEHRA